MKKWMLGILGIVLVLGIVGCQSGDVKEKTGKGNLPKELIIAYLPNEGTDQMATQVRGTFAKALGDEIGIPVKEIIATDYNAAVEAMRTGKAHMAFFGPLSFSVANERAKAIPLVSLAPDGDPKKAVYQSFFVVKKDSPIQSIQDIKGKKMGFVDPNSTSGNLVPSAEIMKAFSGEKLTMDQLHTNGQFFEAVMFTGSHPAGVQAVIKGDLDVVPVASNTLATEIRKGKVKESDIRIIHMSSPIPNSPLAIQGDVDPALQEKIKAFLVKYDNPEYFKQRSGSEKTRFIPVTLADYVPVMELSKKLNN